MTNAYYTATGTPTTGALGASSSIRAEFQAISAAFDKLAVLPGNAGKLVVVNPGATGEVASTFSISGVTQLFDPAYVSDYTGIVAGAKRLNSVAKVFEQYDGAAWSTLALAYLGLGGGALTGPVTSTSTWNGQTISSTAALTGTLSVAGMLTAAGFTGPLTGNASTATKLATARQINGQAFDGTADITVSVSSVSGNAGSATKLQTARAINGQAFDGTADITVSVTNIGGNAATATKASTLAQGGGAGSAMTFNWSGQGGQPAWVWGGTDGINHYVYNPSNFSVSYATTAGTATSATSAGTAGSASTAGAVAHNASRTDNTAYPVGWFSGANSPAYSCANVTINSATGTLAASALYSSGDVTAFSDARVKTDVEQIANGLAKVRAMRGVTYTRTDEEHLGLRQAGVIAQEVQAVMSEFVKVNDDGMLSVAYGNMVSVLIEAIKELADQVDELRAAQ